MTYNLALVALTMLAMVILTIGALITTRDASPSHHATRYAGKHSATRAVGIR